MRPNLTKCINLKMSLIPPVSKKTIKKLIKLLEIAEPLSTDTSVEEFSYVIYLTQKVRLRQKLIWDIQMCSAYKKLIGDLTHVFVESLSSQPCITGNNHMQSP